MRDEDRDAVSDADSERCSFVGGDVSVRFPASEPTLPPTGVHQHTSAMYLSDRHQPARRLGYISLNGTPTTHHFVHGVCSREAERPSLSCGSERANPPRLEIGDDFFGDFSQLSVCDRQRE